MALKIKSEQCGKCEINNYSKYNRNYWNGMECFHTAITTDPDLSTGEIRLGR